MNIILINNYYTPHEEGSREKIHLATSQTMLAEKLVERGHSVRVISRRIAGTKSYTIRNGVEIHRTWFLNAPFLRFVTWFMTATQKLFFQLLKKKADIILCWDWSTVYPAIIPGKIFNIPVVCSIRGKPQGTLANFAYNLCDYLLFSSQWIKKFIQARTTGEVIHQGIDLNLFNKDVEPIVKSSKFIIGYFGRLYDYKGVGDILKAVHALPALRSKIKILIVGDGPERDNLVKLSEGLDVEFIGTVPYHEVPKYMAGCDVVVLPSYHEGFSSVPLEAMAMGKVAVCTSVGGAPEIIRQWENGVLFSPGDVNALREIIEKLINDRKLLEKIGERAHDFVVDNYSWDKAIDRWENILKRIKSRR